MFYPLFNVSIWYFGFVSVFPFLFGKSRYRELTVPLGVHFIVTPPTFLYKGHLYLVLSLNFHIQLSVQVIKQNQSMCLYDTIVLFYTINTEQFHYK